MPKKILLSILSVLCFLMAGCSDKDEKAAAPRKTQSQTISYDTFESKDDFFSMQVPENWIRTVEDGEYHFSEKNSGADIFVYMEDYYPDINNCNYYTLSSLYNNNGITLANFMKNTGDSFSVVLNFKRNDVDMTEYKTVMWGYNKIYYINYLASSEKSGKYIDVFNKACETFQCTNTEYTYITPNYACYYNDVTGASIEYPLSWNYNGFESGFSVSNEATGTTITVDNVGAIDDFDGLTQLQYLQMMQNTVANISLSSYSNSNGVIIAESFFNQNNIQYVIRNLMINKESFILNLTLVAASEYIDTDYPHFETMINSIKICQGD